MTNDQRWIHTPVLLEEVIQYLKPESGKNYIDATADGGGHSVEIIKAIQPNGKLLLVEWDEELFRRLEERLKNECSSFKKNYALHRGSYAELGAIARALKFTPLAGVLFDLGASSFHFEGSRRGFSFQKDEPLDMRYSRNLPETAGDILNRRSAYELEETFKNFGEERFARVISRAIVEARLKHAIRTSRELVEIVRRAIPARFRNSKIHFATRTFQALRIAVNHELENIERGLTQAARALAPGGRIVVISFHSLEDRIVKQFFRSDDIRSSFEAVTPKPVRARLDEIRLNPRSRSARLRAYQKKTL